MSRKILAAVSDMIFASKISGAASQVDVDITFVKSADKLMEQANNLNPELIILDLNNSRFDSLDVIKGLKASASLCTIPIVGFLSHVQVELRSKAQEIGCNFTMPRSQFTSHLPQILSGEYFSATK